MKLDICPEPVFALMGIPRGLRLLTRRQCLPYPLELTETLGFLARDRHPEGRCGATVAACP
jgi:hypothetical protein